MRNILNSVVQLSKKKLVDGLFVIALLLIASSFAKLLIDNYY
ncbi:hypothetical protein [Halarcobacter mediterraneus]|nr:hypothetical protein [Halarcobacter mediterraneus]